MIDSMFQEGTDKVLDDRVSRPLNPPPAPPRGFWAATGATVAAPFKGIGAGAVESGGFMADVLGAFSQVQAGYGLQADPSLLFSSEALDQRKEVGQGARDRLESGEAFSTETGAGLRATARRFAPDPATANVAEQILFGLGRFATKAVGYSLAAGPAAGAALTGADEGMTEADKLKAEGVDFTTRTKVGIVAGAAGAAGVALPVAGKTLGQTAALVAAGGPGAFIAQQAASRAILEHADYKALANQYDPFDPVGLAVSTLVPAGFGAYAMRGARSAVPAGRAPVDPAAGRELVQMAGNERTALAFNDPRLDSYAVHAAQREGIPPEALLAIKNAGEKSGSNMVSPKDAKGVMQFIPDTWKAYGKGDPRDPVASIDAGARYMKDLIKQYDGDVRAAIAHYNGGGKAGAAVRAGRDAPATETQKYLQRTDAYLAERHGTEAGKAAAQDPEVVAAARVQLARDTMAESGLHDPADGRAADEHAAAVFRAQDQIAAGERVDISDIISAERLDIGRAYDAVRSMPGGDRFDPMVAIRPEDMEAVAMSRGGWKGLGDMEVKGSGFGLVKFIWRHGEESKKAPELQVTREDLMSFPEVIRSHEPSRQAAEDGSQGREWRAALPGPDGKPRTVVFAENRVKGSEVRQMVSAYVQEAGKPGHDAPLSKAKTDLGPESSGKRLEAHTGDTAPSFLHQAGQVKSGEPSIAEPGKAAISSSLDAQAAEIARLAPDMMVQLEGMDAPMRMADALELIKAEAQREIKDAPLLQVAAECFLRNA